VQAVQGEKMSDKLNFFNKILSSLTPRKTPSQVVTKSTAGATSLGMFDREFFYGGGSSGQSTSAHQMQSKPYLYSPWISAAAYTYLTNISQLHFYLYYKDEPHKKINDHEVLDLLRKPNFLQTRTNFLQDIILNLLLAIDCKTGGQAFLIPTGRDLTQPVDLSRGELPLLLTCVGDKFVRPATTPTGNGEQMFIGWYYDRTGRGTGGKLYLPNQVIRIYQCNPHDMLKGVANESVCRMAIQQDLQSSLFNEAQYTNSAIPTGILTSDQDLTPEQAKEIEDAWHEQYGGVTNNFKTAVMGNGIGYKSIQLSHQDMQFKEGKEWYKEEILASFHVNKIAVGDYEKVNFATLKEARRMLWQDAYRPLCERILEAINSSWVSNIDKGLRLGFDYSKIDALKDDITLSTKAFVQLVQGGFPPALAAAKCEIPLSDEELALYPQLQEQFSPTALTGITDGTAAPGPSPTPKAITPASVVTKTTQALDLSLSIPEPVKPDTKSAFWSSYIEKTHAPGEKTLKVALIGYLNAQRNKVLDRVDSKRKTIPSLITKDVSWEIDAEDFLPDLKDETARLTDAVRPAFKSQQHLDAAQLADEGLIDTTPNPEGLEKYLEERQDFLEGINKTTYQRVIDSIEDTIQAGKEDGISLVDLYKNIKQSVTSTYEDRKNQAIDIARNETGSISNAYRDEVFKRNSIEYTEWVTADDEKVRDSHVAENGSVVALGDEFPTTKCKFPQDPDGEPEEVINCRCVCVAAQAPEEDSGKDKE
jgi:SPP1 gp7 family putative phage head morphogenesis protein